MRKWDFTVLTGAIFFFLLVLFTLPARSQSPGDHGFQHPQYHDIYKDLKQPGTGLSCCNGTVDGVEGDCRPTRAYLSDDGQWRALIDGKWTPFPPRVVLQEMAPDGHSHVCANKSGVVYCFIRGSPKS